MTQEDKRYFQDKLSLQRDKALLLKDLCARLYTCNCMCGTALTVALDDEQPLEANQWIISNYDCYNDKFIVSNIVYASDVERTVDLDNIRLYLFPLSSMTKGQREELYKIGWYLDEDKIYSCFRNYDDENYKTHTDCFELINWCYKNNFDINGLIEKGLAIDASGLDIY